VPRQIVIAYWLIPAEPARTFFQSLITELARKNDAPVFKPHVTIHVGTNEAKAAEYAVSESARRCKPIMLEVLRIDHSDQFTKTLFVQFAPENALQRLNAMIRNAAQDSTSYELNPHLSLLYKTIPAAARSRLASSISIALSEVTFDVLQAVRCVSPTQTRADVEAWDVATMANLCGLADG
jgi:2'-5' RNA ligase